MASFMNDVESIQAPSIAAEGLFANQSIDVLFDRTSNGSSWEPIRPPQALGELLDSRFMIPLLFPSNPRFLAALPAKHARSLGDKRISTQSFNLISDKVSIRSATDLPLP